MGDLSSAVEKHFLFKAFNVRVQPVPERADFQSELSWPVQRVICVLL